MQRSHLVHGAGAQKWAPGPSVHTIFVSSKQSTALFSLLLKKRMFQNGVWQGEHRTILCRYIGTGSQTPSVDSPLYIEGVYGHGRDSIFMGKLP